MPKLINLVGKRYGRWLVLCFSYKKGTNYYWKCKCDCGTIKDVQSKSLNRGDSKSCGCLFKLSFGESALNHIIKMYRDNAKRHKREFSLTKNEFAKLIKQNCFYCGIKPKQKHRLKRGKGSLVYNGVDRINNNKGYTIDNVVTCCGDCNYMKRTMSVETFLCHIKKIHDLHFIP